MIQPGNRASFMDLLRDTVSDDTGAAREKFYVEGLMAARSYVSGMGDDDFVKEVASSISSGIWGPQYLMHARLANCLEDVTSDEVRRNVVNLRRILTQVRHMVPVSTPSKIVSDFCSFIGDSYLQSNTAPSDESMMTACAPIVPYVGRIVTPWTGIVEHYDDRYRVADDGHDENPSDRLRGLALTRMNELTLTNGVMATLMQNCDRIRNYPVNDDGLAVFPKQFDEASAELRATMEFIGCRFLYEMAETLGLEKGLALARYIGGIGIETPASEAFAAANDYLSRLDEAGLDSLLDNIDDSQLNRKFFRFQKAGINETKDMESKFDQIDNFNVTTLMNYIYTSRRYYADYYTNTAYMKMRNVGGYAFYRDFIIIEPQDIETGNKLDFIYCPVRDQLNDRRVVIITMDRSGKILPITERAFNDFLAGRVPLAKKQDFTDNGVEAPDQSPDNETESTVAPKPTLDGVN